MKKIVVLIVLTLTLMVGLLIGAAAADTIFVPSDTTIIEAEAFYGVDADTIILPEGVTTIGDRAFGGSSKLQTVYVPERLMVSEIETAALQGSPNAHFVSRSTDWTALYEYDATGNTVIIKKYKGTETEVIIPAVIEGKPVTIIGNGAFKDKTNLTKVVIPEGVTEIQYDAFDNCTALADVTFPSTLQEIKANSFRFCGNEAGKTVYYHLPDHLTTITDITSGSNYAFINSKAVLVVTPDCDTAKLLSTASDPGRGCFTYPDEYDFRYKFFQSETGGPYDTLYLMAYAGADTVITIPDHEENYTRISVIDHSVFKDSTTLTKVVIPEGVTEIRYDAFDGCYLLTDITFPSTLHTIADNAFRNCGKNAQETVYYRLPDNLTAIGGIDNSNYAFINCPAIMVVTPDSNTARLLSTAPSETRGWFTYPNELDFRYKFYQNETDGSYDTLHLMAYAGADTVVTIPDHEENYTRISVIDHSVFQNKTTMTKVVIPEGVTIIRYDAFDGCYALTDITFPSTLHTIADNAFRNCGKNAQETVCYCLPDNLTAIEGIVNSYNYAFTNCPAIMVVTPDSNTARLLSTASSDTRGWFTYPNELDFRYKFYQNETDGSYDTLHLMAYVGTDTVVTIPDHEENHTQISVIDHGVFQNKTTMTKVIIPEGVTEIRYDAFDGCTVLSEIAFPESLSTIGRHAFRNCAKNVGYATCYDLPNNITSIESDTFDGCAAKLCCDEMTSGNYTELTPTCGQLGNRWSGWAEGPFRIAHYPVTYKKTVNGEEQTVTINRKKLIGYVADLGMNGSLSVTIPEDVLCIDDDCFRGRTDLGHVIMEYYPPQAGDEVIRRVCRIGARAFKDCSYLTDITFTNSLNYIGEDAFAGCGNSAGTEYTFSFNFPAGGTISVIDHHDGTYSFADCNAKLEIQWTQSYEWTY